MKRVSKAITAQNQFSDSMQVYGPCLFAARDTSSMIMTGVLQVKVDGNWLLSGKTLTVEGVSYLEDGCGLEYRVGVATGGFTSGTATLYLIQSGRVSN